MGINNIDLVSQCVRAFSGGLALLRIYSHGSEVPTKEAAMLVMGAWSWVKFLKKLQLSIVA